MDAPGTNCFSTSLVLAGAGKMGGALLRAWLDRGYDPRKISVIEPRPSRELVGLAESKGFALGRTFAAAASSRARDEAAKPR